MLVRLLYSPIVAIAAASLPLIAAASPTQQASAASESSVLAQGWTLLAKGDAPGAASVATQQLARDRYNVAALVLLIDAELARGGPTNGLDAYEKWLGTRRLDNGHALRRVARAWLLEARTSTQPNALARLEALKALAADGDATAALQLEQAATPTRIAETRALATLGNERAIKTLLAQLSSLPGKTPIIEALGESGSTSAVPHLKPLLSDPNDMNRAAAAEALGRLGARDAVGQLKQLLKDPHFTVRMKAAGALIRLNDMSGLALLTELSSSEHAGVRVAAARELAPQADGAWQTLVRSLTGDPDPAVRLEAARLIAPYDQPLASSVVEALMRDPNVGIREAASDVLVQRVASDFATLRRVLRSGDPVVRVRAAGRILEITRS